MQILDYQQLSDQAWLHSILHSSQQQYLNRYFNGRLLIQCSLQRRFGSRLQQSIFLLSIRYWQQHSLGSYHSNKFSWLQQLLFYFFSQYFKTKLNNIWRWHLCEWLYVFLLFRVQNDNSPMPTNIMGLVGMGYTPQPNFLDLAYQQNQIKTSQFILSLAENSAASYLYYDELPQSIINGMQYSPVEGQGYWQLSIQNITTNNSQYQDYAPQFAVIDSGTTVIALPQSLRQAIAKNDFPDCKFTQPPIIIIVCPYCPPQLGGSVQMPTFTINFRSGVKVYLPQISYTMVVLEGKCVLLFESINEPNIILGDIFFRQYYVSFNKLDSLIGFKPKGQNVPFNNMSFFIIGEYVLLGILIIIQIYGILVVLMTCPRYYQITQQTSSKNTINQNTYQIQPSIYYGGNFNQIPNDYQNQVQIYKNPTDEIKNQ